MDNLCDLNKAVSSEVFDFMQHVKDVKEESITDYLIWKWSVIDSRFKYLDITTFTRTEESTTTGADFELELWLVGKTFSLPLVFQAKKFVKPFDGYFNKLNYPKGTQKQLATLLKYTGSGKKRLPFYIFYSQSDSSTKVSCRKSPDLSTTSMFINDAVSVKEFADGDFGKRIAKNALLEKSLPFHCLFCCPWVVCGEFFKGYFPKIHKLEERVELPDYASILLNGRINEMSNESILEVIDKNGLRVFRYVAAYDMRQMDV